MAVTLLRTVILYIVVIAALRLMGKRQIGDMQPGELVITILISELASMPIQDTSQPMTQGVLAIFTLVIMEVLISFISMKCAPLRRLINGHSAILIKDGVIDQRLMKAMRVTVSDLLEVLRGQNVFDISQVSYAILETNGQISILLKSGSQPVTREDLGVKSDDDDMPIPVVSDGKIVENSLTLSRLSREDVQNEASRRGIKIKQIFLMTVNSEGKFYIVKKN